MINSSNLLVVQDGTNYCKVHYDERITFINTDYENEVNKGLFKCSFCLMEQQNSIHLNQLIPLGKILNQNQNIMIDNWPITGNHNLNKEFQEISNNLTNSQKDNIKSFFSQFKQNIINKINELEQQFLNIDEEIKKLNENALASFNKYSQRNQIKQIVLNNNLSYQEKTSQLSEIINDTLSKKEKIQNDLKNQIQEIKKKNRIDLEKMEISQKKISNILSTPDEFMKDIDKEFVTLQKEFEHFLKKNNQKLIRTYNSNKLLIKKMERLVKQNNILEAKIIKESEKNNLEEKQLISHDKTNLEVKPLIETGLLKKQDLSQGFIEKKQDSKQQQKDGLFSIPQSPKSSIFSSNSPKAIQNKETQGFFSKTDLFFKKQGNQEDKQQNDLTKKLFFSHPPALFAPPKQKQ